MRGGANSGSSSGKTVRLCPRAKPYHRPCAPRARRHYKSISDPDALDVATDEPGPDRSAIARDELRRLQHALERLPARAREAVIMKKVEGLSRREIAERMGITEKTVKWHLNEGVRALADILYGVPPEDPI